MNDCTRICFHPPVTRTVITKLSYLGPPNTFSEKAAGIVSRNIGTDIQLIPMPSIEAVARSLKCDEERCDLAVLPYYNYLEGLVQESMDLIYEHRLCMIGAQRIAIEWAVGKYPDSSNVEAVYSHSKALAQCSEYLWEHYPEICEIAVSSTADGAGKVRNEKAGLAIAGCEALRADPPPSRLPSNTSKINSLTASNSG